MHRKGNAFRISCTKITGDDDACAHRCADKETDQKEDQAAGGVDRSERFLAEEVADDPGVRRVIELLKQLAQEDRCSKPDKHFPGLAFGQQRCGLRMVK